MQSTNKMMTIGIPRALIYWKRPEFWEVFFEEMGCRVVLSPKSNKEIVEMGVRAADPETCFSNKIYWGHVLWLEGKCDRIFVPRLKTNKDGLEYCPKFFGLPDIAKILVKTPILTETFDQRREPFEKTMQRLGRKIDADIYKIERAMNKGLVRDRDLQKKREEQFAQKMASPNKKILLVSHPYNLYDEYSNLRIEEHLRQLGAEPIFIDEVPEEGLTLGNKLGFEIPKFHWEFGLEMLEKIGRAFEYNLSGAIEISSFQCGCDAVIKEFVEKAFRTKKIPFLYLIIDEQTGEAGYRTRLEAFIDTLKK